MLLMTMGSMLRGKRRILKSARDTKTFWASSTLRSSISTYTVKVDKATCSSRDGDAESYKKGNNKFRSYVILSHIHTYTDGIVQLSLQQIILDLG